MISPRIVYVSGTHGTGKSTLIAQLVEKYPSVFERFERIQIPKSEDCLEREKIRTVRFYLQTFYENVWVEANPQKILLCDRCVLDNHGYVLGFRELGWVSDADYSDFINLYEMLFSREKKPKNVVFLDPLFESRISNIQKRWVETREVKWREENFEYLRAVMRGFQDFFKKYDGNVLRVRSDSLDERVAECYSWIMQ